MMTRIGLLGGLLLAWLSCVATEIDRLPPHPRLLATAAGQAALRRHAAMEPGKSLAAKILRHADTILVQEPLGHAMVANRLLYTARRIQERIHHLGIAFWLTGNPAYADCAIRQMEVAASFPDWNDRVSFLDAAEMTAALAIGYDWFFARLTPEQRETIAVAILEKGLKRALSREHGWVETPGNWNTVCHAAMLAGALAIAEREPEIARQTLQRLRRSWSKTIPAAYGPNGAYAEGPGYWHYGTDYLCLGLGILQSAFGTDFGLSQGAGFEQTGDFISAMTGPSWYLFNYGDGAPRTGSMFSSYFLADRFNRPDYLGGIAAKTLRQYTSGPEIPYRNSGGGERMLPLALFFLRFTAAELRPAPEGSYYSGAAAPTQVATLRNRHGWVGIKGGSPQVSHGHMDGGSFVYDYAGLRWAYDIGNDNYEKAESSGRDLWNLAQNSDRWRLFRTGPDSHNILRLNGGAQQVDGSARFLRLREHEVLLDLTSLYRDQARTVTREIRLEPDGALTLHDRLTGLRPGATVHWQLCTPATVTPDGNAITLQLRQERMRLTSSPAANWQVREERDFQSQYYAGPAGIRMVSAAYRVPDSGTLELTVTLKRQ